MDWSDLNLVLAVCRSGTLSGAARALGVNHSTVFRRINAIEKSLGVRLFDRRPDGYAMTEAGEVIARTARRVADEVDSLDRQLLGRDLRLEGLLRVTSPQGIALKILNERLSAFCVRHPGIQMDLVITSDALKLSRREADIAVRVTRRPPDNLIGQRICKFRFAMYASRQYMRQHGDKPLEEHQWILTDDGFDQLPPALWKRKAHGTARVVFGSNSTIATMDAAKRGLGVAPLPCFLGDGEAGLTRMGDPPEELTRDLWVLTHPDLRNTARVKALMADLVDALDAAKSRFEGTAP